jgi:hypothetical protein
MFTSVSGTQYFSVVVSKSQMDKVRDSEIAHSLLTKYEAHHPSLKLKIPKN